jgi:hypothetical protein
MPSPPLVNDFQIQAMEKRAAAPYRLPREVSTHFL